MVIKEFNVVSDWTRMKGRYQGVRLELFPGGLRDAGGSVQSDIGDFDK